MHDHADAPALVVTPRALHRHWQGHRSLTRKVIDAFPDDALFGYSIGEMRPFSDMAREMMGLAASGIHGIARGDWKRLEGPLNHHDPDSAPASKTHLLELWDGVTAEIDRVWPEIPSGRLQERDSAWGMYDGPVWSHVFYFIDNEVHHRGQGYVYLRSLGIEPPPFWDRG
jgi:uncharacterized damage-inducible protein DinB